MLGVLSVGASAGSMTPTASQAGGDAQSEELGEAKARKACS